MVCRRRTNRTQSELPNETRSTTAASTTAPTDDSVEDDNTDSSPDTEPTSGDAVEAFAESIGLTYDDELKTCLADRGIDLDGPLPGQASIVVALVGCAPEETTQALSRNATIPAGRYHRTLLLCR